MWIIALDDYSVDYNDGQTTTVRIIMLDDYWIITLVNKTTVRTKMYKL